MIHYHGGPITPYTALYELAGRCFCVSFARPEQIRAVQGQSQSTMGDCGEFKFRNDDIKAGLTERRTRDWTGYYSWVEKWFRPCDWFVVPDVIDGGTQMQDALIREWPHPKRMAAPVWHMDEPISRLLRLCEEEWNRVCIGSTAEYWQVMSDPWRRRMDETWNEIDAVFGRLVPPVHMLRGMQLSGREYPFASADSTDIAQNHNRPQNTPRNMADRWDALQCPGHWHREPEQMELAS